MFKVNENYLKLPGSYLFSTVGRKQRAYQEAHPDKKVIRLSIGDVTQPLVPAIIEALHKAVDEMGHAETFRGYAPDLGYEFLRNAIADNDYKARGCQISADEIFVSDGAKCDSGNIQEIFGLDNRIAVCDPVYPVYVDTNVMAGRTGTYDPVRETWSCRRKHRISFISASPIIRQDPRSRRLSFRNGLIMRIGLVQLSFMMLPMKPIFQRPMCRIPFMNVKVQEPVPLSFVPFPRMQALPA